jgi:hypothetical protein
MYQDDELEVEDVDPNLMETDTDLEAIADDAAAEPAEE